MTTKITQKAYSLLLALIIALGVMASPMFAKASLAYESTGNSKFDSFIRDSRWKDGASYGNRSPYISTWSCIQCCAYTADFVRYCYGLNNPWDSKKSTEFHNANDIKAGDVVRLGTGNATHYFAVLKRNGNRLYTAEGNMNGRARVGWYYTIESANKIGGENHPFASGAAYHYTNDKPIGCIDTCAVKNTNQIHISGWAFDPDEKSKSIAIHVYVNNKFVTSFDASNNSSDVNKVYGLSGKHRFDKIIKSSDVGAITVDIYALDTRGGTNPLLGKSPNISTRFSLRISPSSGGNASLQNGSYRIKSTNGSGKYVTATKRCSGGNVALYSKGKGDQIFTFKRNSDGTYTISSGVYCLEVRGAAYKGTVQLYWSNSTAAQRWNVVSLGNGNYRLVNKAHSLVMDISGNSKANGTDIHTWEPNNTSAQVYKLERVS